MLAARRASNGRARSTGATTTTTRRPSSTTRRPSRPSRGSTGRDSRRSRRSWKRVAETGTAFYGHAANSNYPTRTSPSCRRHVSDMTWGRVGGGDYSTALVGNPPTPTLPTIGREVVGTFVLFSLTLASLILLAIPLGSA